MSTPIGPMCRRGGCIYICRYFGASDGEGTVEAWRGGGGGRQNRKQC